MNLTELIERLDKAYPEWRLDFGLDAIDAANELGLLDEDEEAEVRESMEVPELDFNE